MQRGMIFARGAASAGATALLALAGCSSTAEDIARDDASRKATAIGKEVHGSRNLVWTAEDLGRRAAARDDMTLLQGDRHRPPGDGLPHGARPAQHADAGGVAPGERLPSAGRDVVLGR